MSRVTLAPKLANEDKRYVFEFIGDLQVGETLVAASAAATIYSGGVSSIFVSAALPAVATLAGSNVNVIVSAGSPGMLYFLVVTARTSQGQMIDKEGFLSVIPSTS